MKKITRQAINKRAERAYPQTENVVYEIKIKSLSDACRTAWKEGVQWALNKVESQWIDVKGRTPKESGRYWCYIEEVTENGLSHFQWNCAYDAKENEWRDRGITYRVTHWTNLLPAPKNK